MTTIYKLWSRNDNEFIGDIVVQDNVVIDVKGDTSQPASKKIHQKEVQHPLSRPNSKLPNKELLYKELDCLISSNDLYKEIILDDWATRMNFTEWRAE